MRRPMPLPCAAPVALALVSGACGTDNNTPTPASQPASSTGVESGAGIQQLTSKTVDFAGSEVSYPKQAGLGTAQIQDRAGQFTASTLNQARAVAGA